ncbi:MAG: DNA polymerase III subunit gamma/tau, partial [Planctomycetes bacterium]|nr:DNA polymerase III subunit gamma/tau [Planctomycetota bacterium]
MAKDSAPSATPYKVLALKYRPQTFSDIIGQDHIKTALSAAIDKNKVAHAFMFAGSRGTGKTTSARILAKALNCLSNDGPTKEPCGTCAACKEIADSRDMDVLEIDGASNNGVEQIRELRSVIDNRPVRDRYRIIIIDEVHMLSIAAFNALLKTLEEPPPHVKFIFATTDPHKVPETIHSRCQHYDFRRLSSEQIVESLAKIATNEGVSAEDGVYATIGRISEGGMRDAQSKLDQLIAFRGSSIKLQDVEEVFGLIGRKRLLELASAFRAKDTGFALNVVDEVFTQGKDLSNFVAGLIGLMRDLLILHACGGESKVLDLMAD